MKNHLAAIIGLAIATLAGSAHAETLPSAQVVSSRFAACHVAGDAYAALLDAAGVDSADVGDQRERLVELCEVRTLEQVPSMADAVAALRAQDAKSSKAAMALADTCTTPTSWIERDGRGGWRAACGDDEGNELYAPTACEVGQ
jgi:hypothetical protein